MSSNRNRDEMTGALIRRAEGQSALERSSGIDFADHASFHGTVTRAVLGGAGAALITDIACRILGIGPELSAQILAVTVTTGVLGTVASRGKKWWRAAIGGLLGATGAGLALATGEWPLFAGALL